MKRLLLTPLIKRSKKSAFFSSLNQNTCPVYDAKEKKKNNKKLLKIYTHKKKGVSLAPIKSRIIPITQPFLKS